MRNQSSLKAGFKRRALRKSLNAAGQFLGRRSPGTLLALSGAVAGVLALFNVEQAQAATLYWDGGTTNIGTNGDGVSAGGSGDWNTSNANWDQGNGLAHVAWTNGTNIAGFGGATGTVTLKSDIVAGGINFYYGVANTSASSRVFQGSGAYTLSLSGSSVTIDASTCTANANITISAPLVTDLGSVLHYKGIKANVATILSGSNTIRGTISVDQGRLTLGSTGSIGSCTGITVGSNAAVLGIDAVTVGSGISVTLNGTGGGGNGGSALQGGNNAGGEWAGGVILGAAASIGDRGGTIAAPFKVSGAISGNYNLTINSATGGNSYGQGVVYLSGTNNSYTGATSLNGGSLMIRSIKDVGAGNSSLGAPTSTATGTIGLGSTTYSVGLVYTGTGDTSNRVINLAGTTGGATIDQSGAGLLKFTSNLTATGSGIKTLTLQGSTGGTGEISGKIVDSSGGATSLMKAGSGTWTLSGANTFTGNVTVSNGELVITNSSALGTGAKTVSIVGATGTTAPELHLDGSAGDISLPSTMSFTTSQVTTAAIFNEAGDNTIAGNFSLTGGNGNTNIKSNGGTLTLSGDVSIAAGQAGRSLVLQGGSNGTVSGIIQTNGSTNALTLTKEGSGTWTLTGANTYTGATTISGGKLLINGDQSAATGTVTVATTATLGGTGTIGGAVTVQSGGHLAPGNSPGALVINNTLTLNSGSVSDFEIASTSSYDQVTGLTGLTYGGTLNVTGTIASAAHTYTLFSLSSGTPGGDFSSVNLATAPAGYRWHDFDAGAGVDYFNNATGQIQLETTNFASVKLGLVANALSGSLRSDTTDENDENGMNAFGTVHVTGSNGGFVSEIDGLTNEAGVHDFADGYVQVDNDLSPAPTLVMLWLKDTNTGDGIAKSDVINFLAANAGGAYTVLTSSDEAWQKLAGAYSGFDTIIDFGSVMGTGDAFSWKFEGDFAAITVDKVAVVPEPGSLGLLGLGALALMSSRRRKPKKPTDQTTLGRFYARRRIA